MIAWAVVRRVVVMGELLCRYVILGKRDVVSFVWRSGVAFYS